MATEIAIEDSGLRTALREYHEHLEEWVSLGARYNYEVGQALRELDDALEAQRIESAASIVRDITWLLDEALADQEITADESASLRGLLSSLLRLIASMRVYDRAENERHEIALHNTAHVRRCLRAALTPLGRNLARLNYRRGGSTTKLQTPS